MSDISLPLILIPPYDVLISYSCRNQDLSEYIKNQVQAQCLLDSKVHALNSPCKGVWSLTSKPDIPGLHAGQLPSE